MANNLLNKIKTETKNQQFEINTKNEKKEENSTNGGLQ